jgi:acyl-CoA thioesterase FadM
MLSVTALGKTSINLNILLQGPDAVDRVRGKVTLVLIDRKQHRAIPIPDEVRARILNFQADSNDTLVQPDLKGKVNT